MRHAIVGFALLAALTAIGCGSNPKKNALTYDAVDREIKVDGDAEDWRGIAGNLVQGERHLWLGQGMSRENWRGNDDLSYSWRAAWHGDKLYFLFIVTDDKLQEPKQPITYRNDCVMLFLDWANQGGPRIEIDPKTKQETLHGYELHFLPTTPPRVYLDHANKYALDKPQSGLFKASWNGEVAVQKITNGYTVEIGLTIPSIKLQRGKVIGVESAVSDDDGAGRKSLMNWTGDKAEFWKNMDGWGQIRLVGRNL